jgi:serine/threonine-protein kinase
VAKLVDTSSSAQRTQTGALMGTPLYMAPEQARSAAAIDERADLYSLGCMLYEMLVGEPPFKGEGAGEIIAMQMFNEPEAPSARVDDIPAALERVVLRLLEKEPGARYATAAETSNALAAALSGSPAARSRVSPPTSSPNIGLPAPSLVPGAPAPTAVEKPRNVLPLVVAAAMLVIGGAIALVLVMRERHDERKPSDHATVAPGPEKVTPAPVVPPVREVLPTPVETPPVVPITPVISDEPPSPPPGPGRPPGRKKPLPVTDKGSPIETSID